VFAYERELGQWFVADLELTIAWPEDDLLTSTVDYGVIARETVALLGGSPVNLIETLAANIADQALTHIGVHCVKVRVSKPEAPLSVPFDNVSIIFTKERNLV
jgi:dihydroneopterin aldolase